MKCWDPVRATMCFVTIWVGFFGAMFMYHGGHGVVVWVAYALLSLSAWLAMVFTEDPIKAWKAGR